MSTAAQIAANQANSQQSSGPRTAEGKAASSQNRFRHGLTGPFRILGWEKEEAFKTLEADLFTEHKPLTATELILVQDMARSHWLRQRAITLQNTCFSDVGPTTDEPKDLALYLRYQTTHDRAFYKALATLQNLRKQKSKEEIGFVSQKRREEQEAVKEARREAHEKRLQAADNRAEMFHQARVWLTEAQARRHETETTIAKVLKMPRTAQTTTDQASQVA